MADSPDDPTQTPTHDEEEAAQEGAVMTRDWVRIAVFAIFAMVLVAIGLLQATGLVDLMAPLAEAEATQWLVYAVLVAIVLAVGVWSWVTS